eukprot:scaffold225718_cov56-Cyclotella_meneghiniana.AAC.1
MAGAEAAAPELVETNAVDADAPSITEDDMVFTLYSCWFLVFVVCWVLVVLAVRSFLSRVDFKYAGNSRKLARFNSYH